MIDGLREKKERQVADFLIEKMVSINRKEFWHPDALL